MNTFALDQTAWDMILDAGGNIAMAANPYAQAQDIATACLTWQGEAIYDTTLGIPGKEIMGQSPSISFVKESFITEALTVPDIVSAQVVIDGYTGRKLTGQIQAINTDGQSLGVTF